MDAHGGKDLARRRWGLCCCWGRTVRLGEVLFGAEVRRPEARLPAWLDRAPSIGNWNDGDELGSCEVSVGAGYSTAWVQYEDGVRTMYRKRRCRLAKFYQHAFLCGAVQFSMKYCIRESQKKKARRNIQEEVDSAKQCFGRCNENEEEIGQCWK